VEVDIGDKAVEHWRRGDIRDDAVEFGRRGQKGTLKKAAQNVLDNLHLRGTLTSGLFLCDVIVGLAAIMFSSRPITLRLASMLDGNRPIFSTSQCDWLRMGRLENNMTTSRNDDVSKE